MADVTINAAVFTTVEHNFEYGPFWTSDTVGYVFFVPLVTADKVQYSKTTDGGATWGAGVDIVDVADNELFRFHVWFDKNTPGDSGTKIHVVYQCWGNDSIRYRSLDTASDTLGTEVTIATGITYTPNTASWVACNISITKAKGGNLYVSFGGNTDVLIYRSTDAGVNWTARTAVGEGAIDVVLLMPANTSDTQDICAIFDDVSANAISVKVYDDSANTWGETAIAAMVDNLLVNNFAASVRHSDGHVLLAFWNAYDTTTADLQTYDITVATVGAGNATVTAKTNVVTDSPESAQCCVFIDQATDDVYIGYLKGGTWTATVGVFYKLSTDDMGTWGSEVTYDEGADDDYRQLSSGLGVKSGQAGRFYIVWNDDDDNDLFGNKVNSIAITVSAGTKAPPPRRQPWRVWSRRRAA